MYVPCFSFKPFHMRIFQSPHHCPKLSASHAVHYRLHYISLHVTVSAMPCYRKELQKFYPKKFFFCPKCVFFLIIWVMINIEKILKAFADITLQQDDRTSLWHTCTLIQCIKIFIFYLNTCRQQEVEMRKRDVHGEALHLTIPTLNLRIASISSQEQVISGSCLTVVRVLLIIILLYYYVSLLYHMNCV